MDDVQCPIDPLFDNVLVVRVEPEERKVGLIIVPDSVKEKPVECEVVSIGADVKVVNVGDRCIVGRFAGAEFEYEHKKFVVIREMEILGVIRNS